MIRVENLSFAIGDFRLGVGSLEVESGEYFVLLGPPGSGKTIFLECLCGLKRSHTGRIYIDGREVTHLEPRERRVGYVPQDYALFPHFSVARNIQFGLRARGVSREAAARQIGPIVDMLGIGHLMRRWPATLSGGEQQRVALARALVTNPRLLLLDEPVSALDEGMRESVCRELRRIQRDLGITTLHISHNLEEAFSVADLAAIMNDGRIVQTGPFEDLVRRPRTVFVARFLRAENVFLGRADGTMVHVGPLALGMAKSRTGPVNVMIRPEKIGLSGDDQVVEAGATRIPVRIERRVDRGPYVRVDLDGPVPLVANASHHAVAHLPSEPGATIYAVIHPDDVHVLEQDE